MLKTPRGIKETTQRKTTLQPSARQQDKPNGVPRAFLERFFGRHAMRNAKARFATERAQSLARQVPSDSLDLAGFVDKLKGMLPAA